MRSLVLEEGDGRLFERIYCIAAQLTNPHEAKALLGKETGEARFWQTAFYNMGGDDRALTSAILQAVQIPFGAYVLTGKAPDRLEITPWLFCEAERLLETFDEIRSDDVKAETLYSLSRSLRLTADFLTWLNEYSNSVKRG